MPSRVVAPSLRRFAKASQSVPAAAGDAAAAPAGDDAFDLDDFESYLDTLGTGSK